MLHLAVDKEFTYLNYLSVLSAIKVADVKIWVKEKPENNKYWDIVTKIRFIEFDTVDPIYGITASYKDQIGRLDIIYLGKLNENYVSEALVDHKGMYEVDGEFETKDMCLISIKRPELITPEYIKDSNTTLANLIKTIILERNWNVSLL